MSKEKQAPKKKAGRPKKEKPLDEPVVNAMDGGDDPSDPPQDPPPGEGGTGGDRPPVPPRNP